MFTLDALYPRRQFRTDGLIPDAQTWRERDPNATVLPMYKRVCIVASGLGVTFLPAYMAHDSENPMGLLEGGLFLCLSFVTMCVMGVVTYTEGYSDLPIYRTFVLPQSFAAVDGFIATSRLSYDITTLTRLTPHHDTAYEDALKKLDEQYQGEVELCGWWQDPITHEAFRYPVNIILTNDAAGQPRSVTRDFSALGKEIYAKLQSHTEFDRNDLTFTSGSREYYIRDIVSIELDREMAQQIIDMVNIRVVPTVASHETVISVSDYPLAWFSGLSSTREE